MSSCAWCTSSWEHAVACDHPFLARPRSTLSACLSPPTRPGLRYDVQLEAVLASTTTSASDASRLRAWWARRRGGERAA